MTNEPLVSVILPVWNREAWVERAIDSVRGQTYQRLELIVIDDGSTDGTGRVLRALGRSLTVLSQAHRGPYAARNAGLRRATGQLVAFIDSDDAWYPRRVESQVPLLGDPEVGLVFGDATQIEYGGGARSWHPGRPRPYTSFQITPPRRGWVAEHFAYGNFVPTSSVLVRRRCFEELGEFRSAPLSADYAMWFRVALRYKLHHVDHPVFEYAVHAGGISRNLWAALRSRLELFEAMLLDAPDPRTRDTLLHILFNLRLHLLLARLRRTRPDIGGALADGVRALRLAPPRRWLGWSAAFAGNQVRVRLGRRLGKRPGAGPPVPRP